MFFILLHSLRWKRDNIEPSHIIYVERLLLNHNNDSVDILPSLSNVIWCWKLCQILIWSFRDQITKWIRDIMVTVLHRNNCKSFVAHLIHHWVLSFWEKGLRLGKKKKTKIPDKHCYQSTSRLHNFQNFFSGRDKVVFEESKNRFELSFCEPKEICCF